MSVTNGNDSGPGSLREQLCTAAQTITIDPTVKLITLESTLAITRHTIIEGHQEASITISKNGVFCPHMIVCNSGTNVMLKDVALIGNKDNAPSTALAHKGNGALSLIRCRVADWVDGNTVNRSIVNVTNCSLVLQKCLFHNNLGSGIVSQMCDALGRYQTKIIKTLFCYNTASHLIQTGNASSATGAIHFDCLFFKLRLEENTVSTHIDNISNAACKLVYSKPNTTCNVTINQCIFNNNILTKVSGVIHADVSNGDTVRICQTRIENNISKGSNNSNYGSALSIRRVCTGRLALEAVPISIKECQICGNRGVGYGAIRILSPGKILKVSVSETTIAGNIATSSDSYCVLIKGPQINCTWLNTSIEGNQSSRATVLATNGCLFKGVTIVHNTGKITGGIHIPEGSVTLINSIIMNGGSDITGLVTGQENLIACDKGLCGMNPEENYIGVTDIICPIFPHEQSKLICPIQDASYITQMIATKPILEIADIPCHIGDTMLKVREFSTGQIQYRKACDVYATKHELYNCQTKSFTPIIYNAVFKESNTMLKIPKDLFGHQKPETDLYVNTKDFVCVNGRHLKAKNLCGTAIVKVNSTDIFAIVCSDSIPIDVNGVQIYSWSKTQWHEHVRKTGIIWSNNMEMVN